MMKPMLRAIADVSLRHVSDADLLRQFTAAGDHRAFELLVWRHRQLVMGVCHRVTGNVHDAEDAFQATFLVLARRAEVVRGASVAGWLTRVAYRCAVRVRKGRRPGHPGDLSTVPAPAPIALDPDLARVLDAELNHLPDKYRVPLVMCYLHGKTYHQVAGELNCPVGTLCGWLTRGKALLRDRLARRGVALSAGGLATHLGILSLQAAAGDDTARSITALVATFTGGGPVPERVSAVADGVLRMMTWKLKVPAAVAVALLLGLAAAAVGLDPPRRPDPDKPPERKKADADRLQGTWVFDAAGVGPGDMVGTVWTSKLTVAGASVVVDKFLGLKAPLKGTITLDPTTEPKSFDLKLDAFDLAEGGLPVKIAAGTYPGVYALDGNRVRLRFSAEAGGQRPAGFGASGPKVCGATLVKAPAGFTTFPKEIVVKVVGPDGEPVSGAVVASSMMKLHPPVTAGPDGDVIEASKLTPEQKKDQEARNKIPEGWLRDETSGWTYRDAKTTGRDGTAKFPYEEFEKGAVVYGGFCGGSVVARGPGDQGMGIARVSPASLVGGTATVALRPACRVTATARSAGLTPAEADERKKKNVLSYTAAIRTKEGREVVGIHSVNGDLEFPLPPGEYTLDVIGGGRFGRKSAPFTVPEDRSEFAIPPVVVPVIGVATQPGRPIPELTDVVAWKGNPVKLADLRGRIVLLHFWGYWCGQCVQEMPVLMGLHDAYKDKGLVVVGVHVDAEGEVDSAKALDAKLELYRKDAWKGKGIPFPVALVSGKRASEDENAGRGSLADKFGIRGYPHTVIIGRDGNVVGRFDARDEKAAVKRVEYLLKEERK
jgi:RNA polymerase sigma factor (sigma-70 family)